VLDSASINQGDSHYVIAKMHYYLAGHNTWPCQGMCQSDSLPHGFNGNRLDASECHSKIRSKVPFYNPEPLSPSD